MKKIRIIPTILFNESNTLKGKAFSSWRIVGNLKQSIKVYSLREVDELIILDISASKFNKEINLKLIDEIADECFMPLTVGGGIRSLNDIEKVLKAGADRVSINTSSIRNKNFLHDAIRVYGSQCIVVSVDYKNNYGKKEVFIESGTKSTGIELKNYLKEINKYNPGEVLLTSIDHDGMMLGYDIDTLSLANKILDAPVIASGGCGSYDHMYKVIQKCKISALAASSIFNFTEKTPLEAKNFLKKKGIKVRI
jgi:cyclase